VYGVLGANWVLVQSSKKGWKRKMGKGMGGDKNRKTGGAFALFKYILG
jgi:hypothetical protein